MNELRKGQIEALDAFEKHYYTDDNDKGIISACCGFGKTRLCYEIIKKCINKGNTRFIIVTSRIKLLSAAIDDMEQWSKIENIKINICRVGGGYGNDKSAKQLIDSDDVYTFFESKPNEIKLIVTTYHSSKKILDGLKDKEEVQPDLIIYDEAHNTTGDNEKFHQNLIKLVSEKKLFMTATPLSLQFKEINNILATNYFNEIIYSMNKKNVYGDIFYQYTFVDGIKDNIIVDFKCITLGGDINKDEVEKFKKELSKKTKDEKDKIFFNASAKFLLQAIEKYELKHTLVFLPCQSKVYIFKKMIEKHKKDCVTGIHVYSIVDGDSQKNRINSEKEFIKDGDPRILLSVGIYNEGVDIPCIDSVFFAQERTSPTTIIQNIGRCVRNYKNNGFEKKIAYVILPNTLYYSGEIWDDANDPYSSGFKQIRKMIKLMTQKNNKKHYYEKNVETKDTQTLNHDPYNDGLDSDNETEKELGNVDKNKCYLLNDIDLDAYNNDHEANTDLKNMYGIQCTDKNVANLSFDELKQRIQNVKVKTIRHYTDYRMTNSCSIYNPEKDYQREWISWSNFFGGETFTIDQAKLFIKKNLNLTKINTPEEWFKYYDSIVDNELLKKKKTLTTINEFIKLTPSPRDYYKDMYKGLDDYLGKTLIHDQIIQVITNNPNNNNNADKNLKLIANEDDKKIMKPMVWNNFDPGINNDEIKKYIDTFLNIDCNIQSKIQFKRSGNFENVKLTITDNNNPDKVLGYIDPMIHLLYYDEDYNKQHIFNKKDQAMYDAMSLIKNEKILDNLDKIIEISKKIKIKVNDVPVKVPLNNSNN